MERHKDKYIVIKRKDAEAYLNDGLKADLDRVCDAISERREADGRHAMECVVVECDWPEYEHVWDMIEDRVDGAPLKPDYSGWWWYADPDQNLYCVRVDRGDDYSLVAAISDVPSGAVLRIPVDALQGEWHGEAKFPIVK